MVLGLVPFSAMYLFQRVFYAFGDARTPFYVQVLVIAVWTAGNLLAAGPAAGGRASWWASALAMSLSNLVGAGVLAVLTRRRIGGIDGARVLSTYLKCVVAALLAGMLGWRRPRRPTSSPERAPGGRSRHSSSAERPAAGLRRGAAGAAGPRARDLAAVRSGGWSGAERGLACGGRAGWARSIARSPAPTRRNRH